MAEKHQRSSFSCERFDTDKHDNTITC